MDGETITVAISTISLAGLGLLATIIASWVTMRITLAHHSERLGKLEKRVGKLDEWKVEQTTRAVVLAEVKDQTDRILLSEHQPPRGAKR